MATGAEMEKHSCKTYFVVYFNFDREKNAALLRERFDCLPEEIGIFNKEEVEKFIIEAFGVHPQWDRHCFIIGYNEMYNVNVNEMLRITLKDLFGKEDKIKELCKKFGVTVMLEIVPYIVGDSEEPCQILSLERDIIEFLYDSGAEMDIDYYVL